MWIVLGYAASQVPGAGTAPLRIWVAMMAYDHDEHVLPPVLLSFAPEKTVLRYGVVSRTRIPEHVLWSFRSILRLTATYATTTRISIYVGLAIMRMTQFERGLSNGILER